MAAAKTPAVAEVQRKPNRRVVRSVIRRLGVIGGIAGIAGIHRRLDIDRLLHDCRLVIGLRLVGLRLGERGWLVSLGRLG